jgi:hypothetical protein
MGAPPGAIGRFFSTQDFKNAVSNRRTARKSEILTRQVRLSGKLIMFFPARTFTGHRFVSDQSAMPSVNDDSAPVRVINFHGIIDNLSEVGAPIAARKARKDPAVRLVVVSIDSARALWDFPESVEAIAALSDEKLTVAYIHNAIGKSLVLAYFCRAVFAHPTAEIGQLESFVVEDGAAEDAFTQGMFDGGTVHNLQQCRPDVNERIWWKLLNNTVSGEAAEHFGIVDFLALSEAAVIDRFSSFKAHV